MRTVGDTDGVGSMDQSYFPAVNDILTPIDMARNYYAQQLQNEINRQRAMNEIPSSPVAPIATAAATPIAIPSATPRSYFPAANPLGSNLVYRPNTSPTPQPTEYFNPVLQMNPNLAAAKPNFSL